MAIAGLDPSLTHLGWVLIDETKQGKNSLLSYGVFKTDTSDGLLVQRLIMQRERVKKFLTDNKISFIAMEAPLWKAMSTELLFALNQFLHEIFLDLNIMVLYVQPYRLKRFAYPDPKIKLKDISKHHITHQAKTELGLHGKRFSEHIADAWFIGKLGSLFYNWYVLKTIPDEKLPDDLLEYFAGKHTFTRGGKKGITEYTGCIYKENEAFFDYRKHNRKTSTIISEVTNV